MYPLFRSRLVALVAGGTIAATALRAPPAAAVDITCYVAATVNFVQATTAREYGDEERAQAASTRAILFLAGGLLIDLVGLMIYVQAGLLDHVERLDAEVANGGGPITEAYAAAFGLTTEEVLASVRASRASPTSDPVQVDLLRRLLAEARLTDEAAGRLLWAFHEERARVASGDAPWHQNLSALSGVPVEDLAPLVAAAIDEHLEGAAVPGTVLSARTVLAQGGAKTLRTAMGRLYDAHADAVDARMYSAAEPAR